MNSTLKDQKIAKLKERIEESLTVFTAILPDLKKGSVGETFVKNEMAYIIKLRSDLSALEQEKETKGEVVKDELSDWSIPDGDSLNVPDEFDKLFHKIGMQMRFHTISGKNEFITIAHIIQICHEFFTGVKYAKSSNPPEQTDNE